jgi:chromatin remodeling complex protein RSC6
MTDAAPKKPNGLQKVLKPSPALAEVVGPAELSRGEVVSKMWAYIKGNNLQNPANKREIVADDKLKPIFDGKDKVDMFEMNKHLAKHLT